MLGTGGRALKRPREVCPPQSMGRRREREVVGGPPQGPGGLHVVQTEEVGGPPARTVLSLMGDTRGGDPGGDTAGDGGGEQAGAPATLQLAEEGARKPPCRWVGPGQWAVFLPGKPLEN